MNTKLLIIAVLTLKIFLPCALLQAEELPWTQPKISERSPSQSDTKATLNNCCICYYDSNPDETTFQRQCEQWLEEPAQISGCTSKRMVALPSESMCPPESCADAFPGQKCDTLSVHVASHSLPSNCKPFINAAVSLCLSVGTQCGEITHSGCSTFKNYEEALEYLRTLQREHPKLHLRITANQCTAFNWCGTHLIEYDTPCLIVVEPEEISCSLPSCKFGGDCRDLNRPSMPQCDFRSSCSERAFREGTWQNIIREEVCCPGSWEYTASESCAECNGVCCHVTGDCTHVHSRSQCSGTSLWGPGVTSCGPGVCRQDVGACCGSDGCFDRFTREQCGESNKWFRGKSCEFVNCGQDIPGACCLPSGCTDGITKTLCRDATFIPNGICPMACPTRTTPIYGDPGPGITRPSSPNSTSGMN